MTPPLVTPALDIVVEAGAWPPLNELAAWFERGVHAVCVRLPFALGLGEISVLLSDDASVQAINMEHRGQDKPTNVLSFPALARESLPLTPAKHPFLLGDLVFALETVEREAERAQISLHDHMLHLIVHGFLHLLGYDHEHNDEAEVMEALEILSLASLGVADPYRQD